jgi:AcrR family transcriptional regulator
MKNKKQHVVETAERLFIERGYQETSIQDIIESSGISKGTFYNYFTSKSELIVDVFHDFYTKTENSRDEWLVGKDPSDIQIFIKQIELQVGLGKKQGFFTLFEELLNSPDVEAKQLISAGKLRMIRWLQRRFIDIFGEDKKPYLLDCAIMFLGILSQNIHFCKWTKNKNVDKSKIITYSVNRLVEIVKNLSETGEQLYHPIEIEKVFGEFSTEKECFELKLEKIIQNLKTELVEKKVSEELVWLDFILDEMTVQKTPRKFLLENAIMVLEANPLILVIEDFKQLKNLISQC